MIEDSIATIAGFPDMPVQRGGGEKSKIASVNIRVIKNLYYFLLWVVHN